MADVQRLIHEGSLSAAVPNVRNSPEVFQVVYTTPNYDKLLPVTDAGVALGAVHPLYSNLRCRSWNSKAKDTSCLIWIVSAEYTNQSDAMDEAINTPNPIDRRPKIRIHGERFQEYFDKDIDGKPVLNTVGQKFSEPLSREAIRGSLIITRNEPDLPTQAMRDYQNTVNSSTFYGGGAGKWKMAPIEHGDLVTEGDYQYYPVTYTMEFWEQGWEFQEVLNQGRYRKGLSGQTPPEDETKIYPILDGKRQKVTEDVNLSKEGQPLADGDPLHYVKVKTYKKKDWGPLNL